MNRSTLSLATCALVVGLSGCALTTDRIEIPYTQQQGVSQIAGAKNITVSVQVTDQRQDKSKVSSKKNGYGMEMAPILAIEEVSVTVRRATEQELRARGFQFGTETAIVQIAADLTRFCNDHKTGFFSGDAVAELNMSVTVQSKKGETLSARVVIAQGVETNTQLASGDNAKLALSRALQNGMKLLFEDQAFLTALVANSSAKLASN